MVLFDILYDRGIHLLQCLNIILIVEHDGEYISVIAMEKYIYVCMNVSARTPKGKRGLHIDGNKLN
jgi:hypothetical protein